MEEKRDHLDRLNEYQEKQYLPHTYHIQKGSLPFPTRQLMKQGAKKYIFLFILALPLSLALPLLLQSLLHLSPETLGAVAAVWVMVIAAALALFIVLDMRRRARAGTQAPARKKKKKSPEKP